MKFVQSLFRIVGSSLTFRVSPEIWIQVLRGLLSASEFSLKFKEDECADRPAKLRKTMRTSTELQETRRAFAPFFPFLFSSILAETTKIIKYSALKYGLALQYIHENYTNVLLVAVPYPQLCPFRLNKLLSLSFSLNRVTTLS